jgi:hypothetical protein
MLETKIYTNKFKKGKETREHFSCAAVQGRKFCVGMKNFFSLTPVGAA